jgi:magnesium-transporting ATPase (P-type)
MMTGDSSLTAVSVGLKIGLIESLDETPEILMSQYNVKSIEEAEKMSNVSTIFIINFLDYSSRR